MKILNRLLWPITPLLILSVAIISIVLSVASGASLSMGILLFAMVIFFGALVWIVVAILFKQGLVLGGVIDSLLVWIRGHENQAFALLLAVTLAFVALSIIWAIGIFTGTPEESISLIKGTFSYEISLLVLMIILLMSIAVSKIQNEPRLTEDLKDLVPPEFIEKHPQAAIEHAFTFFEHTLREQISSGSELYGEALINEAFGNSGKLTYSTVRNEQQGIRNLMSGAYALFRNPRKHRLIEDDKLKARAIIILVDLLTYLVDELKDEESGNTT